MAHSISQHKKPGWIPIHAMLHPRIADGVSCPASFASLDPMRSDAHSNHFESSLVFKNDMCDLGYVFFMFF